MVSKRMFISMGRVRVRVRVSPNLYINSHDDMTVMWAAGAIVGTRLLLPEVLRQRSHAETMPAEPCDMAGCKDGVCAEWGTAQPCCHSDLRGHATTFALAPPVSHNTRSAAANAWGQGGCG